MNLEQLGSAAVTWHRRLARKDDGRGDPASRAALRRARSPLDVCMVDAFYDLRRSVPHADVERLALVASVLAHVDDHQSGQSVARQLAGNGVQPAMHPLRFQRLLQTTGWSEKHRHAVRAVRLLDGRANVDDLARSLASWDDPSTRRRWALDYFEHVTLRND